MAGVLDDAEVNRVLSITAHPDDVDFGAAGTIAQVDRRGIEVIYCVVTDGDAGGLDEDFPRADVPALRRAEQIAAAKCVGRARRAVPRLPGRPGRGHAGPAPGSGPGDQAGPPQPRRLPQPGAELRPDGSGHPDHRAVGSAALDAVYPDARNPFAFPELRESEGLAAWTVREVWIAGVSVPNHYVDVTATFGRKVAALRAHESQISHMDDLTERLEDLARPAAGQAGLPDGRLAEAFQVLDTA